jgi:hypothetical protein
MKMTVLSAILMLVALGGADNFVVDASAHIAYTVNISRDTLRLFVDDVGLFRRNMSGVVGVDSLGDDTFLYRTSREVPLRENLEADFIIKRTMANDTLTVYRTPDVHDANWMECRVELAPVDQMRTSISISLRLRMQREHSYEVHWLAPLVGADFISDRMNDELATMLKEFAEKSSQELVRRFSSLSQNQKK